MTIIDYLNMSNLKKTVTLAETIFYITEKYSITVENEFNSFFIDKSTQQYSDRYTYIGNLEVLKQIYLERIGKSLDLSLRKQKLKNLNKL